MLKGKIFPQWCDEAKERYRSRYRGAAW